jgi:hypothetical protein
MFSLERHGQKQCIIELRIIELVEFKSYQEVKGLGINATELHRHAPKAGVLPLSDLLATTAGGLPSLCTHTYTCLLKVRVV